jgi:uncharacterized membrane protein
MKHAVKNLTILCILFILLLPLPAEAQDEANVKAVLFYSPTCGHCHIVINETLPPLWQLYGGTTDIYRSPLPEDGEPDQPPFVAFLGDQLSILYVDISTPEGSILFTAALEAFDLPETEGYVPTLFVGDTRLVGSGDIPSQFPGIISSGLDQGGIDWPLIPGIDQIISELTFIETVDAEVTQATADTENPEENPVDDETEISIWARFNRDVLGNSISVIVLLGMLVSVAYVITTLREKPKSTNPTPLHWAILPVLILGFIVAGYLSYVESSGTEAVCGPVGDCNTVQNSPYAVLFGLIPIGTLGLIGYSAILIAWILSQNTSQPTSDYALLSIFGMAIFGTLFSIYLTFLEPFIIGATCAWCLTSAILMTVILLMSMNPALHAYARIHKENRKRRR